LGEVLRSASAVRQRHANPKEDEGMSASKTTKKSTAKRSFARQRAELVDLRFPNPEFLFAEQLDPNLVHDKERMAKYLPEAERALEQEHAKLEAGDKRAVLRAVYLCATYNMPMPDWTRHAFLVAYNAILNVEAKSWDDVFGRAFPKKVNWSYLKNHVELKNEVWREMCLARIEGKSVVEETFSDVGKKLGKSAGKVRELFYEAKGEYDYWPDSD
jgi:hypothetical protein